MSTTTWNDSSEGYSNNNPVKIVIPIAICVILILGVFLYFVGQQNVTENFTGDYIVNGYYDLSPSQIRVIEIVSGHAWGHGLEVNQAFDCLGRKGSTKSFKTTGFKDNITNRDIPTNLWLCQDDDGSWYAVVTTVFEKIKENKVARLITAYRVSTDLFPTINDYINHIVEKWGAIGINYALNSEKIFLQPK